MIQEEKSGAEAFAASPRIDAAERDVARAHARFSDDLRRVSRAGHKFTSNIVQGARPALIGVAVLTGLALIVTALRSRRDRSPGFLRPPAPPPLWQELASRAVTALAASAGQHLAAKLVSLAQEQALQPELEGGSGPRPPADS